MFINNVSSSIVNLAGGVGTLKNELRVPELLKWAGVDIGNDEDLKSVCMGDTGAFKNMSRSEAKEIAESNGGKVLGSLSKKLDFLIVGDSKPTKRKIDQAKQLNIKIILEKDWNKILNS